MSRSEMDPLHKAVMRHSLPEVAQAIAQGWNLDALDREGRTPLFYAVRDGDTAIVAELVRRGANVNAQDSNLETPLHVAPREYHSHVATLLLDAGARVDAQDAHGNTPLSRAVFGSKGRGQMIKLLLGSGANKALKNKHGVSPEDLARSIGNYDVSQFF